MGNNIGKESAITVPLLFRAAVKHAAHPGRMDLKAPQPLPNQFSRYRAAAPGVGVFKVRAI